MPTAFLAFALVLFGLATLPARAAESYDSCSGFIDALPATITRSGTWCLRHDLGTAIASGAAIEVAANNVTIDCNDFKLGGLAAGNGSKAHGISLSGRLNLTVRNCSIRGFGIGVFARGEGGGHVIEDNRFDGNLSTAITTDHAVVRRNLVSGTGGYIVGVSTAAISAYGTSDVLDNIISGVRVESSVGKATGIRVYSSFGGTVSGNRVSGVAGAGSQVVVAIEVATGGRVAVRDNILQSDIAGSTGILCDSTQVRVRGTMATGFATATSGCGDAGPGD